MARRGSEVKMKVSWHHGGLFLEPETSKETSALMRLVEVFVLLGIGTPRRGSGREASPTDGESEK